jgi:preprotein translocase subunit SecE
MGRLSKKKPASKKKRKPHGEEDAQAGGTTGGAVAKTSAAGEVGKKPASAPKKPAGAAKPASEQGWIGKSIQFLREVKAELKKVTWPSRKQTVGSTVVVLVLVMIIALFLGVADMGLSALARVVLQ